MSVLSERKYELIAKFARVAMHTAACSQNETVTSEDETSKAQHTNFTVHPFEHFLKERKFGLCTYKHLRYNVTSQAGNVC